jgi:peptidoglycan/xylan/chitin deacetylase (PgdA/CDA1 family)
MGAAARRRIEERHAMSSMVRAYSDLYEETFDRVESRRTAFRSLPKRAVARAVVWSGWSVIHRAATPAPLRILTYHRVLPLHEAKRYPFHGMVVARDVFDCQIAHLARHYKLLPLEEALDRFRSRTLPHRAAVITFDDGYRDNYEHAFPILKRYGAPATLFLVTDILDRRERLWWDEVADGLIRLGSRGGAGLPSVAARVAGNAWWNRPQHAAASIVTWLNDQPRRERREALSRLRESTGTTADDKTGLMMTWDDAREMGRSGISFGTHSKSHAFLEEIDTQEVVEELKGSRRRLEAELGIHARWLAYPRGRAIAGGEALLESAGIEAAVTTRSGLNAPGADRFALRRLDAGHSHLDIGFDAPVFEAELAGILTGLRGA